MVLNVKVIEPNRVNKSTIAEEFSAKLNEERRRSKIVSMSPIIILLVMIVVMSATVQGFFTYSNFINILYQISSPLVLATGLTFVIVLGSIDLSVEGVMGFSGSIVTLMVLNTKNGNDLGLWAILISIALGTLVGVFTGFVHVKLRIPSFMVTFGVSSIMIGFGVMSYMGRPAAVRDPLFLNIAMGKFLSIPYLTWFAFVVFVVGYIIQQYTAFGRHVFAIGENESILRSTGVNVDKIKILVFMWSAFCSSVAGIFGAFRLNLGQVAIGNGFLFYTITAVVVGGTSLAGGKGGVVQSLVGVLIVTVVQNCMILTGINPYIQASVQGVIIIVAVSLTVLRGKKIIVK